MGAIELNKVAVCMGKAIKMLAELEPQMNNSSDVYENKEAFCIIAYMCRIGILDRIEQNTWLIPETPIRIPTGLFSSRKETLSSGLKLTIDRLKDIVAKDVVTLAYIEDILNKGNIFYEHESFLPDSFKKGL